MEERVPTATVQDLGELTFGALGVFVIVGSITPFTSLLFALPPNLGDSQHYILAFGATDFIVRIAVGSALIAGRKRLAKRLGKPAVVPVSSPRGLLGVALAAVGIWLALKASASLASQVATGAGWRDMVGAAVLLVLSVAVFAGGQGLVRLWEELRGAR